MKGQPPGSAWGVMTGTPASRVVRAERQRRWRHRRTQAARRAELAAALRESDRYRAGWQRRRTA